MFASAAHMVKPEICSENNIKDQIGFILAVQ